MKTITIQLTTAHVMALQKAILALQPQERMAAWDQRNPRHAEAAETYQALLEAEDRILRGMCSQ